MAQFPLSGALKFFKMADLEKNLIFEDHCSEKNVPIRASSSSCPGGIYLFKVSNRNTRTVCSKLTIKTTE